MKVLFISNDSNIFDATSAARKRMRSYARAIGELHVLSQAPKGAQEVVEETLFLHPVSVPKVFRIKALERRARRLIIDQGIEVVSAQDPFEHGLAALRAVSGTPAKLHIQVHTDFLSPWFLQAGNWRSPRVKMPFLNRWRLRVAEQVLPQAQGIRVVSERIKQSLLNSYGSRIVEPTIVPIAVDMLVPEPVRLPSHPNFTFALMCVGRLEPEKRIEDILAALALVVPKYPAVGLVIVGEGREHTALEKMTHKLGLQDKVMFLGNRPDAWGLMCSAQAFIQASGYEGYGRTLIEAALAKVPIITTDVGIVGEVFTGFEDVLAVPVADPTALSLAIVGFIEDNEVRIELPIHAEEKARAHLATVGDLPTRIAADLQKTSEHA